MTSDTVGDNSRGIALSILAIVMAAGLLFGMRTKIGINRESSWVIFIAIIGLIITAYFGYIPGVRGAWCTDPNGITTKYKSGKCVSNIQ